MKNYKVIYTRKKSNLFSYETQIRADDLNQAKLYAKTLFRLKPHLLENCKVKVRLIK
jgi:hypothetical protein